MAAPKKLKVYRTPIGFHDAYVAAPSQKAALEAWGSKHNLFAQGVVETVTDPALTEAPLAEPGTVIKRSRGSAAEQIAALPATAPDKKATARATAATVDAKPKPRPSRTALDKAEAALAAAAERHAGEDKALAQEQAALDRRRRQLAADHASERDALERTRDREDKALSRAMKEWRSDGN